MANLNTNRVNTQFTDAQIAQIEDLIQQIKDLMPFAVGLNKKERKKSARMSVKNRVFTERALLVAEANPEYLPPYLNVDHLRNDLVLHKQTDDLRTQLLTLVEIVDDTNVAAGAEAFGAGLAVYEGTQAAAKAGVPGAHSQLEMLSYRFKNQGKNKKNNPHE